MERKTTGRITKFRAVYIDSEIRPIFSFEQDSNRISFDGVEFIAPINGALMQFTGLHDKNGTEIYEGDILSRLGENRVVKWDDEDAGYWLEDAHGGRLNIGHACDEAEIVGNIYETPELQELKQDALAV